MAISLVKGQKVSLDKEAGGLKKMKVGLGWDTAAGAGADFDLDASVFMLGENGKIPSDGYFIFYNNLNSADGSCTHTGDNQTGEGEGDDELVEVDLTKVDASIQEIVFVVTIHEAVERKQNFGQVKNAFIRICSETDEEMMKYELDEDFSVETAITFGRLYRRNGEWKFEGTGVGKPDGLQGYLNEFS